MDPTQPPPDPKQVLQTCGNSVDTLILRGLFSVRSAQMENNKLVYIIFRPLGKTVAEIWHTSRHYVS